MNIRFLFISLLSFLLFYSGKPVSDQPFRAYPSKRKMVLIPSATYHGTDYQGKQKVFALGAFYIDAAEVTNEEYGKFVSSMRQSLQRQRPKGIPISNQEIYYLLPHLELTNDDGLTAEQRKEAHKRGYYPERRMEEVFDTIYIYPHDQPMLSHISRKAYFTSTRYKHYPVVGVSKRQAEAYCHWRTLILFQTSPEMQRQVVGFRLPTEQEFEYASAGNQHLLYATETGKLFREKYRLANFHETGFLALPEKGGRFPRNIHQLFDMCGNVAEWTSTPMEFENQHFVTKGGAFTDNPQQITVKSRIAYPEASQLPFVGFRCVCSKI